MINAEFFAFMAIEIVIGLLAVMVFAMALGLFDGSSDE